MAESRLADAKRWARLTSTKKTMNASGTYPLGNYTVTSRYDAHEGHESVNMTGNTLIVIPEFPSLQVLALPVLALVFVAALKRAYKPKQI